MSSTGVYRTASGMIFRVTTSDDGHLAVDELKPSGWVSGPIGMVGLRIAEGTRELTERQVGALNAGITA
jgi:hypothetical protein